MKKSQSDDYQTLPQAAQQQNQANDVAISPYVNSAAGSLKGVESILANVAATVGLAYRDASPDQRKHLQGVEVDLIQAGRNVSYARDGLQKAEKRTEQTLAKDGNSQFVAAQKGDPRSMEAQVKKQQEPKRPKKAVKKIVLSTDRKHSMDRKAEQGRKAFNAKTNEKPAQTPRKGIGSKQVENHQAKPQPRPSLDMAGGSDAAAHQTAKAADNQAARKENSAHAMIAAELKAEAGQPRAIAASSTQSQSGGTKQ